MLDRGEVAERLKAAVLKTAGRKPRGFESLPLRHASAEVSGTDARLSPERHVRDGPKQT